jgi:hypothetical protein
MTSKSTEETHKVAKKKRVPMNTPPFQQKASKFSLKLEKLFAIAVNRIKIVV